MKHCNPGPGYRSGLRSFIMLSMLACQALSCVPGGVQPQPPASVPSPDTVVVFRLSSMEVNKNLSLPAELLPYENARLYARIPGYVKTMKADLGDRVKKGQVLALIEAAEVNTKYQEFQSSLQASKARYATSADQYQRLLQASRANTPGIVAPVDLVRAENQMKADSASWEAARKLAQSYREVAGYLTITAPFDGVVTSRGTDPGDLVGANNLIFTVQNTRILRLRVAVPETYAAQTATTQADFRVDGYAGQAFGAKLTRKSETIDPATRTEIWEFDYSNDKGLLKAGSFANVLLKLSRNAPGFLVPFTAVVTNQEKRFVQRVKNDHLEWVDVTVGITTDQGMEVFGPFQPTDTLVLGASDERKPGARAFWKMRQQVP